MSWSDGGKKVIRNVDNLPHKYTVSQPSEDGGMKFLRNVGNLPQHYTASQPRRPRNESSSPWKPRIPHQDFMNTKMYNPGMWGLWIT